MTIEYPNRKFIFDIFISNEYDGKPQEFEENTSEWVDIKELLQKEKILSNIMILDRFFILPFSGVYFILFVSIFNIIIKRCCMNFYENGTGLLLW